MEHWRRRKFRTAGCLIWQINDCWPVVSWSVVDYFGRPKAGYYVVKRAFAPVLITVIPEEPPTVWLVNDTLSPVEGTAVVTVQDGWGKELWREQREVTIAPNAAQLLLSVPLPAIFDRTRHFIAAQFFLPGQSEPLSYDAVFLAPYSHLCLPPASVTTTVRQENERVFTVQVHSHVFVKGVCLSLRGEPEAEFSDNAFDLLPNMTRTVTVQIPKTMTEAEFRTRLTMWHY